MKIAARGAFLTVSAGVVLVATSTAHNQNDHRRAELTTPFAVEQVSACPRQTRRARIGGRIHCLRVGQQCKPRFNRTTPSYRTYGFLCTSRTSGEPPTLFRIVRPGRAPSTCPGIAPTPTSIPPGTDSPLVGTSPIWIGPYLHREDPTSTWRYRQDPALRGAD